MAKVAVTTACALLAVLSCSIAATGASEFYRFVAKDTRLCPSPHCGGDYIEKVNLNQAKVYVYQITYVDTRVEAIVKSFRTAYPAAAIVYFGQLVAGTSGVKNLRVATAYLGMPGQPGVTGLKFYTIATNVTSTRATLLNVPALPPIPIKLSSVKPVNPTNNLDLPWQLNQILQKGAVVAGTVTTATPRTISIKAVYIKLPVKVGPCPVFRIACDPARGGLLIYNRTVDLCFIPSCTYDPLFCILSIPTCTSGYRLAGWPAPPGGCAAYACDPIFSPKASIFPY